MKFMKNMIKVDNVSVYYERICALEQINLTISEGDFLGIIGPNGGGKTTLLKVILGLITPSSGRIIYDNPPLKNKRPLLGYVPQFSRFDKHFPINVTEAILMGRLSASSELVQRYNRKDREIAERLLDQLEIRDLKDRQIGELSGGQLQRVLIARALAMEPAVLLLDEPTASLDTHYQTELYSLLKVLNQKITIVLISHDTGLVSACVNKVACLNRRLFYHGTQWQDERIFQQVYGYPVNWVNHEAKIQTEEE
jgi:zinc transport system ATP-binding protein